VAWLTGHLVSVPVDAATSSQVASRIHPRVVDLVAALATGAVGACRAGPVRRLRHPAGSCDRDFSRPACGGGRTHPRVGAAPSGQRCAAAVSDQRRRHPADGPDRDGGLRGTGGRHAWTRRQTGQQSRGDRDRDRRNRPARHPLAATSRQLTSEATREGAVNAVATTWASAHGWEIVDVNTPDPPCWRALSARLRSPTQSPSAGHSTPTGLQEVGVHLELDPVRQADLRRPTRVKRRSPEVRLRRALPVRVGHSRKKTRVAERGRHRLGAGTQRSARARGSAAPGTTARRTQSPQTPPALTTPDCPTPRSPGVSRAERRRSRTYQPWGYHGLPVLKTARVWLWEMDCGRWVTT
jgi:hypothetical protein